MAVVLLIDEWLLKQPQDYGCIWYEFINVQVYWNLLKYKTTTFDNPD